MPTVEASRALGVAFLQAASDLGQGQELGGWILFLPLHRSLLCSCESGGRRLYPSDSLPDFSSQ